MKKFLFVLSLFFSAHAFACDVGYYMDDNNQCTLCRADGYYCPGDDVMYPCPDPQDFYDAAAAAEPDLATINYNLVSWDQTQGIRSCRARPVLYTTTNGAYFYSQTYTGSSYPFQDRKYWVRAPIGYYMSNYYMSDIYYGITACTNAPANAHYTGSGTPDSADGTVVDANDCPWVCDAGYYNNNGTCTACPTGYTSNAGATAENQCFITVAGGHYIGTAGQNSTNWETCAAGYARAEHTVNYGSTSSCTQCTTDVATGRPAYSDTAGAASCTACPAVTGELASRLYSYGYYTNSGVPNTITGCYASFNDDDDTGDYHMICYYNETDTKYNGRICDVLLKGVTSCAAGYGTIFNSSLKRFTNVDDVTGNICTSCPENTYSPEGATTCTACPAGLYSPAGMWESAQCGHILHVGDDVVYLRATKKTSPSVHVKIGNDIFYGNMTTADVPMNSGTAHKLKLNYGGTTYSVYDDTVNVN